MRDNSEYAEDATQNTLIWLRNEYQKPLDEQRTQFVIEMSFYVHELIPRDSSVHEDIKSYISDHAGKYTGDIEDIGDISINGDINELPELKKKRSPLKKVITVGIVLTLLLLAAQTIAYAFEVDLFRIIIEWGESLLSAPYNTEITRDNITVVKSKSGYEAVESAVSDLGIGLLYPVYLPDDNALTSINNLSTSDSVSLFYRFKDTGVSFVVMSYTNDAMSSVEPENIGGYDCLVSDNPESGYVQVNFVYNDMLYTVSCIDYDGLVKTIENLKYVEPEKQ